MICQANFWVQYESSHPTKFQNRELRGFWENTRFVRNIGRKYIELKSWLDRPSGTFILHGGPLRPVVRLVGRSSVEQLQDPGTSQLLLPGERERDPSLQRREEVKLAFIICLIDRKQASYAVSCSMADTWVTVREGCWWDSWSHLIRISIHLHMQNF